MKKESQKGAKARQRLCYRIIYISNVAYSLMCLSFFFRLKFFYINSGILTVGIMDCQDSVTVGILDCRDSVTVRILDCRDFGVGIVDRRDCGCRDFVVNP